MRFKEVYLDNGATTKIDPKALEAMRPYFEKYYGNPSSIHTFGEKAGEGLEKARKIIAKSINAKPEEIYFTSGGTESNNLALKGIAFANKDKNHIITTKVEHKSVINTCKWLEKQGFKVSYLSVDKEGFVDPEELKSAITPETLMFSVIHGNNEIGTINNLEALGKLCKEAGIEFHTDACQSYTKTEIDVEKQNLSMVTLNSHKIHGPKGVGALYIRKGLKLEPWQHGGNHEKGMRSGTENVHGIVGFAEAVKLGMNKKHVKTMAELRDRLIEGVLKIPDTKLNGPNGEKRLCNNANFSFLAIEGEAIGGYLNQKMVASSTGSACSAKTLQPSYVLKAIGLTDEEANGSLRLTLSRFTTEEEIDYVVKVLPKIVSKLRRFSPLTS